MGDKKSNDSRMNRRRFIGNSVTVGAGLAAAAPAIAGAAGLRRFEPADPAQAAEKWAPRGETPKGTHDVVVVKGADPAAMVRRALKDLGALDEFFAKDDKVLIKPNIAWDRSPEQAANTNPLVVSELVKISLEQGAREVVVADHSCHPPHKSFKRSGIRKAAEEAGATVLPLNDEAYEKIDLGGKVLKQWECWAEYPSFDKVINCPIAKHHRLTRLTLAVKAYFGLVGGKRGGLHKDIHENIADMAAFFTKTRPTLTLLDATRILMQNGPVGGKLEDVKETNQVAAGYRQASIDAWATTLFGTTVDEVLCLKPSMERGLGEIDLKKLDIQEVEL